MKTSCVNGSQEDQKNGARAPQNGKAQIARPPDGVSSRGSALRHEVARAVKI